MKKPFCPTFSLSDFERAFPEDRESNAALRKALGAQPSIDDILRGRAGLGDLGIGAHVPTSPASLRDTPAADTGSPPQPKEMLTLKPAFMGMSIDLIELWRRAKNWWQGRRK